MINEKKLNEFPQSLIILSDTRKLKNTISEGLSENWIFPVVLSQHICAALA